MTPLVPVSAQQAATSVSLPWKLVSASPDSTTIGVSYDASCTALSGSYVAQTPTSVLIDIVAKPPTSDYCEAIRQTGYTDIVLDAPLGNRAIVHAVVAPG